MKLNPKSAKISNPRYNRKAAIIMSTTRENKAAAATKPLKALSTGVK
jgi:hypothetical protein